MSKGRDAGTRDVRLEKVDDGCAHLVIRASSSGVESVRDRTFCERNIA